MRSFGVDYDTGVVVDGDSTRTGFDDGTVRRELEIIAHDLHVTAVRVTGDRVERLELAARHASAAGMRVWFSPFVCDLDPDQLVEHLAGCARRAELLRRAGADVVLVLGGEIALFCSGFVPGEGLQGRLATMTDPATGGTPDGRAAFAAELARAKDTLRTLAAGARRVFRGPFTYASGTWEEVDWEVLDVVSVDAYRDAQNAAGFADLVRSYRRFGKPVAVTEFGCCTYRGAADRGGAGWLVVDERQGTVAAGLVRDEAEPQRYLEELIGIFDRAGVDAAFWFTFAGYELPHRPADPRRDLDQASYGLVAVLEEGHGTRYPDMPWEPKRLFDTLAASYATRRTRTPTT
jgi:hypothetical protein